MPSFLEIANHLIGESALRVAASVIICGFLGSTTSTLAGVAIVAGAPEPSVPADARAGTPAELQPAEAPQTMARSVPVELEENPFCPGCTPASEAPVAEEPAAEPLELPLMLVATMESDDPLESRATIWHRELDQTGVYLPDEPIVEGVVLRSVGRGVAVIEAGQAQQVLKLPEPQWRAAERNEKPKPKKGNKPRKKGKFELEGARDAIDCQGADCRIDRAFVDRLIKNPALLAKQGKVKPWRKNGDMVGYKVYRVRKGTLPRLLGLENGDVITSINGKELDSMDRVMKLYGRLKNASNLEIEYLRKGKTHSANIEIS